MTPLERRPDRSLLQCHLEPLPPRGRRRRQLRERGAGAIAQDYDQWMLADYARRRARGGPPWRDLRPAYAFARATHADDWPREDTEAQAALAAHWEQVRGESHLAWARARPVVEDAWRALDHMPAAAVHGSLS